MSGRVALVYDHLWPHTIGGAERWYAAIAAEMGRDGQPVTLVSRTVSGGSEGVRSCNAAPGAFGSSSVAASQDLTPSGVEIVGLGRGGRLGFPLALARHLLWNGGRYEVVHVCSFPQGLAILAARVGLLPHRRTALVADWHEVLSPEDWRDRRGRLGGALGRLVQGLAMRTGDAAVTFSRLHAARLGGRATVVPEFPPAGAPPGRAGAEGREPLVLFAGRLVPQKRAHLLPAVVAELRRHDPSWRGVVYGDGPERERVESAAAALGEGAVEVPGFVGEEELGAAMLRARALVLPTTREGFGLVVLEAAAHGLPSVLVQEPDNAAVELLESGEAGVLCADAEPATLAAAVLRLAADPRAHDRARAWFDSVRDRHSPASAAAELRDLHARLRGGPASAGRPPG
ncbi:MAG: glycosyltransferase family 4 protein [Thermoleophilaceae bacterium]